MPRGVKGSGSAKSGTQNRVVHRADVPRGPVVPQFDVPGQAGSPVGRPAQGFVGSTPKSPDVASVSDSAKLREKYVIKTGTTVEEVIRLDRDGAVLLFDQASGFVPLDPEVAEQLSRENRLRYSMAKEFHDAWRGDEHATFVERFKVDRQNVGSATDKMSIQGPADLSIRWTRPDLIEKRIAQGYHILSADEAKSFLGAQGGHHSIGVAGQTQLVAMGIPKEIYDDHQKVKTAKNNETAGAWRGAAREINQAGGQAYEPSDEARDTRHAWSELPQEE